MVNFALMLFEQLLAIELILSNKSNLDFELLEFFDFNFDLSTAFFQLFNFLDIYLLFLWTFGLI